MKKRSGEAQAAQHRPPTTHHHRLEPRGGARSRQAEYLEEITDEDIRAFQSTLSPTDDLYELCEMAMFVDGPPEDYERDRARVATILREIACK